MCNFEGRVEQYEVFPTLLGSNGVMKFGHAIFLILVIGQIFVKATDGHKG